MIFKKKEKPVDRYWEDEEYMSYRTLNQMNEINESQKRLNLVDGGEYYALMQNIIEQADKAQQEMEIARGMFDEMMGKPLEQLDEMMEVFDERTVQNA